MTCSKLDQVETFVSILLSGLMLLLTLRDIEGKEVFITKGEAEKPR